MIKPFRSADTERLFRRERVRKFQAIERVAFRRLRMLDGTSKLGDLAAAPGSHLEALKGNRQGQYNIRVNDQYRICLVWKEGDAFDVEIVDYH